MSCIRIISSACSVVLCLSLAAAEDDCEERAEAAYVECLDGSEE